MTRYLHCVTAPIAWLMTTAMLWAQADPLTAIPPDALGFVVIRDISDCNARAAKLTQQMRIPMPDLLTLGKSYAGVDKGLNEKGGIAAALFTDPQNEDDGFTFIVVVPVTDYKTFIAAFAPDDPDAAVAEVTVAGEKALVGKKGEFAVFGQGEQKGLLEKVLASSESVLGVVKPLGAWLAQQQLAAVATPAGKKVLLKKIVALLPDASNLPKAADHDADAGPAASLKSVMDMLQLVKELLASANEQLTHAALGVRIDDNTTLHVAARIGFLPEGKLASWAQEVKLPPDPMLSGLPPGKFAIAFGGASPRLSPQFTEMVNRLSDVGFKQLGLSEEDRKKVAAAVDRQRGQAVSSCGVLGPIRPGDSIMGGVITVERVKNAAQHMKMSRELLEMLQAALKSKTTGDALYELHDVTVGDLQALEVITNMGAFTGADDPNNPLGGQIQTFFGRLFGKDGKIRCYMTVVDDRTVVSAYGKEQLERAVAHVRSGAKGLESDPQIAKTAALLPGDA